MNPTPTSSPSRHDAGLAERVDALGTLELPAQNLERAREAAALVLALTDDLSLAAGTLLHAARGADEAPPLPAAVRALFGGEAVRLAASLARLGDFNLDAHWSQGRPLAPDQTEVLRKMLLAVVGDPRLVLA
ncbi:MAG TPA: HD domain-containing protein, partial [Steroidobacteraceae bacterium]|nr:HD domain-containing protein [Steroidobacteraceae bacterium]